MSLPMKAGVYLIDEGDGKPHTDLVCKGMLKDYTVTLETWHDAVAIRDACMVYLDSIVSSAESK